MRSLVYLPVLLLLLTGCGTMQTYSVIIRNVSKSYITDAHIVYGFIRTAGGVVPPGDSKGHGDISCPVPEKALAEWRTEDGVMHRKEVLVRRAIPKNMKPWIIEFQIGENEDVVVVPKADPSPGFNAYDLPDLPQK